MINNFMVRLVRFFQTTIPSWIIFNIDIFICIFSFFLSYLLRFNFNLPSDVSGNISLMMLMVVGIRALVFYFGKTHTMIIRHTGLRDLTNLIIVLFIGTVIIGTINLVNHYFTGRMLIPSSIIIMEFFITAYLLTAARLLIKFIFLEFHNNHRVKSNVIIIGSNELAVATKRSLDLDTDVKYRVIAFLDNKKKNHKKNIDGINIFSLDDFEEIIEKEDIQILIIAKDYINSTRKTQIIDTCLNHRIKVLTAPRINNWIASYFNPKQLKQINIEDLLERDPITLDSTNIKKQISGSVVLVTGAAGSIGSEIVRQLTNFNPKKILLLDQAETPLYNLELELAEKLRFHDYEIMIGDITQSLNMAHIFERFHIDVVYHAAAYKHVPLMENFPNEAIHNNVIGTKILADLSVKHNVKKFVMISTDKAVNPTNIMGASKRIAEMYVQALNNLGSTSFITTRFGNVLGSNGSAIPLFRKQIQDGGPVTVTHPEITRYFMTIPEACQLVLEAGAMGKGGEIYIFDMGKSIKVVDIVKNMIRLSGLEVGKDIQIKYVGLRPGEKLYEELLCDKENTLPTHHPKIMIAKVAPTDYKEISDSIDVFQKLIKTHNNLEVVKLMKLLIPEYKSQNSIFQALDNVKVPKSIKQTISVN